MPVVYELNTDPVLKLMVRVDFFVSSVIVVVESIRSVVL